MSSPYMMSLLSALRNIPTVTGAPTAPTNQPDLSQAMNGSPSLAGASPVPGNPGASTMAQLAPMLMAMAAKRRQAARTAAGPRAPGVVNPQVLTPGFNGQPIPIARNTAATAASEARKNQGIPTDARTPPFIPGRTQQESEEQPTATAQPQVQGSEIAKKLNVFQQAWNWSRSPEGKEALMSASAQMIQPSGRSGLQNITAGLIAGKAGAQDYKLRQQQQQLAMQEYQRKTGLEEREQTRKESETSSQNFERTGNVASKAEANKIDWFKALGDDAYRNKALKVQEKQADAQITLYQKELETLQQSKEKGLQTRQDELAQKKIENSLEARRIAVSSRQADAAMLRAQADIKGDTQQLKLYQILLPSVQQQMKEFADTQLMTGTPATAQQMDAKRKEITADLTQKMQEAVASGRPQTATSTAGAPQVTPVRKTLTDAEAKQLAAKGYAGFKAGDVMEQGQTGWRKVQ